ncbi:unnamed protein product [Schistosoma rodhaini]|uniref:Thioredoxin domain-containing protein n=1 Tax=Schistosoma mansoni TaxID=6183 RepID=A0A3Q0KD13_SCHMA|nr:unnamed protein product [Schistosoma rodhaini]
MRGILTFVSTTIYWFGVFGELGAHSEKNPPDNENHEDFRVNTIYKSKTNWQISFFQSVWSPQISMTEQSHIIPQCKLLKFNWINGSSSNVKFLHKAQLSDLFNSPWSNSQFTWDPGNHVKHPDQLRLHECYILFIFSTTCRFSKASLPYINALARAYPQLPVYGIQVDDYLIHKWSLRMLFVPKLKIIVNGKIFNEYSGSDVDLDGMADFIWSNMRLLPRVPLRVLPSDYENAPQFSFESNAVCLLTSWLVTIMGLGFICATAVLRLQCFTSFLNRISALNFFLVNFNGRHHYSG